MRRIRDIPRFNPEQKIRIISEKEQISGERLSRRCRRETSTKNTRNSEELQELVHLDAGSCSDKATHFTRLTVKGTVRPKITQVPPRFGRQSSPSPPGGWLKQNTGTLARCVSIRDMSQTKNSSFSSNKCS